MAFQDKWNDFRAKVGAAIAPIDVDDGWIVCGNTAQSYPISFGFISSTALITSS